jgi:predicted PilT family ATPase
VLTAKELAEIKGASNGELLAMIRVATRQIGAPLFVGDKAKPRAVKEAAGNELYTRQNDAAQVKAERGLPGFY